MATQILAYGDQLGSRMAVFKKLSEVLEETNVSRSKSIHLWLSKYYDAYWYPNPNGVLVTFEIKDYENGKEVLMLILGDTYEEVRDEVISKADRLSGEDVLFVKEHMDDNYKYILNYNK